MDSEEFPELDPSIVLPLGARPAKDDRDRAFPAKASLELGDTRKVAIGQTTKYWSSRVVLDQSYPTCTNSSHHYCNSEKPFCVGAACKGFLHAAPIMTKTGPNLLDIYHEAQTIDEWQGENYAGTSIRAGIKVLHRLGHIERYEWNFDDTTTHRSLMLDGPLVCGIPWTYSMFFPDTFGFITPHGNEIGGHAIIIIGYSHKRDAYRILNSWGIGWGQRGRAWIKRADFNSLAFGRWSEICSPVERKVAA